MESQEANSEGDTFQIIELGEEQVFNIGGPDIVNLNGEPTDDFEEFTPDPNKEIHTCECGESYLDKDELCLHQLLHTDNKFCPECDETLDTKSEFEDHIRTHLERFACDLCGKVFAILSELKDHSGKHIKRKGSRYFKNYLYDDVYDSFSEEDEVADASRYRSRPHNKQAVKKHMIPANKPSKPKKKPVKYTDKDIYEALYETLEDAPEAVDSDHEFVNYRCAKCEICSSTFCTVSSLMRHKKRLHGFHRTYKCRLCGSGFSSNQALLEHRDTHIQASLEHKSKKLKKGYKCMICLRVYSQKSKLFEHMDVHSEKIVTCEYCKEKFTFLALQTHIRKVHKHEVCQICNESFFNKKLFFAHEKIHFKVNNNTCDYCNNMFEEQKALSDHMASEHVGNSGENKCESCSKVFYCERHLKYHKSFFHLSCHVCSKEFKEQGHLHLHMRMAHKNEPVTCKLCLTVFPNRARLNIHLQQAHSMVSVHKCRVCKKKFNKYLLLIEHMKDCKKETKITFNKESKLTANNNTGENNSGKVIKSMKNIGESTKFLTSHDKLIDVRNKYQCRHCQKGYGCYKNLKKHMLNYHRDIVIQDPNIKYETCELCPRLFITKYELSIHMQGVHVNERKHVCKICDKAYKYLPNLVHHTATAHSEKDLKCHLCEKSFKCENYLKVHLARQHTNKKETMPPPPEIKLENVDYPAKESIVYPGKENVDYMCKQCNQKFASDVEFKSHMLIHLTMKMYDCKLCGEKFKTEYILTKHLRLVHYEEKSLRCEFCQKTFSTSSILGLHQYRKHRSLLPEDVIAKYDANLVRCEICNQQLVNKSRYLNHLKIHSRQKDIQCTLCEQKFSDKLSLLNHMKTSHANSYGVDISMVKQEVEQQEKNPQNISGEINIQNILTSQTVDPKHASNQFAGSKTSILNSLLQTSIQTDVPNLVTTIKTEQPNFTNKEAILAPNPYLLKNITTPTNRFSITNHILQNAPGLGNVSTLLSAPMEKRLPNSVANTMSYMSKSNTLNGYAPMPTRMQIQNKIRMSNYMPNNIRHPSNPTYMPSNIQAPFVARLPSYSNNNNSNNYALPPMNASMPRPSLNAPYDHINRPHTNLPYDKTYRPLYNVLYEQNNMYQNNSNMPYNRTDVSYNNPNKPFGSLGLSYGNVNMPHSNSVNVPQSNSINMPHPNTVNVAHANMPHPNSTNVSHSSSINMSHPNTVNVPHSSSINMPHSNSVNVPHSSSINMPHPSSVNMPHSSSLNMPLSNMNSPYGGTNMPYGDSGVPYGNTNIHYGNTSMPYSNTNVPYSSMSVSYDPKGMPYGNMGITYSQASTPYTNINTQYNPNNFSYDPKITESQNKPVNSMSNILENMPQNLNSPSDRANLRMGEPNNYYPNQSVKSEVSYPYSANVQNQFAGLDSISNYSEDKLPENVKPESSYYGDQSLTYDMSYSFDNSKEYTDVNSASSLSYAENQPLETTPKTEIKYENSYSENQETYDVNSTQNIAVDNSLFHQENKPLEDMGMYENTKDSMPWDDISCNSNSDIQFAVQYADLAKFGCDVTPVYANGTT